MRSGENRFEAIVIVAFWADFALWNFNITFIRFLPALYALRSFKLLMAYDGTRVRARAGVLWVQHALWLTAAWLFPPCFVGAATGGGVLPNAPAAGQRAAVHLVLHAPLLHHRCPCLPGLPSAPLRPARRYRILHRYHITHVVVLTGTWHRRALSVCAGSKVSMRSRRNSVGRTTAPRASCCRRSWSRASRRRSSLTRATPTKPASYVLCMRTTLRPYACR